jgi:hypothetical protein
MEASRKFVAQIVNLLYRRMAFCERRQAQRSAVKAAPSWLPAGDTAGCQSVECDAILNPPSSTLVFRNCRRMTYQRG